jgi:prolyl-tRNA editing enzyme YbaK/EbsC (Cys-tRNA(Pro) deacylase)
MSKNPDAVQRALEEKGLSCTVLELATTTRTANDAANTIGCDVSQIVKSLLFRTKNSKVPVLILASGKNRVAENVIESHIGEPIEKADADFTRNVTGFAIGGIPPLGHKEHIPHIFIDKDLLSHESIWAAAGTPFAVFSIPSCLLESATGGKVIAIQ